MKYLRFQFTTDFKDFFRDFSADCILQQTTRNWV
jgi:hypothetical protein